MDERYRRVAAAVAVDYPCTLADIYPLVESAGGDEALVRAALDDLMAATPDISKREYLRAVEAVIRERLGVDPAVR